MPENLDQDDIDGIIILNRTIVESRKESFGVNREKINSIFRLVNSITSRQSLEYRERIIKKASIILARITWEQPFNNGNKSTALYFTIQFLNKNKLDLLIDNSKKEIEVFELLEKTVMKFEDDATVIDEVFQFLDKNVIDFSFTDF